MRISEGEGWRLSVDPGRHPHIALIGGHQWAVELQHSELRALIHAVATLVEQHRQLQPSLMPEEQIALELDLAVEPQDGAFGTTDATTEGGLHVALEGDGQRWALRFVLTPAAGARGVEGAWSVAASLPLATALLGLAAEVDADRAGMTV